MFNPEKLLQIIRLQTEIAKLGLDLGGMMAMVVEHTLALVEADGAAIELTENDEMVYRATSGIAKPYIGLRLKLQHSLSGLSVQTGEILRCDDTECDDRVDRDACRKIGLRSMIVIPLTHQGINVGVLKAMSLRVGKFTDDDAKLLGLISELIAAAMFHATRYDHDELLHQATHDGLTGLANRALFMDKLRQHLLQSEREQQLVGLLMIDMDGLKQINDTYGHRAGDAALVEFAARIKAAARSTDTVARMGGDEFAVILVPVDSWYGIHAVVRRMYREIDKPFVFEEKRCPLQASIGAACFPIDGREMAALIELADQRMYAVKQKHHKKQKISAMRSMN